MEFTEFDILTASFKAKLDFLNNSSPEVAFQSLGAQRWIAHNVAYKDGVVDIDATSERMNVPVHYSLEAIEGFCHAATKGILDKSEPLEIFLSDTPHHITDRNTSFGHELGHIFLDETLGVCAPSNIHEELFCDYFGLLVSIADEEIEGLDEIKEETIMMLCDRLKVSHGTVIERLMRTNKLPPRIAYDAVLSTSTVISNPYFSNKVVRNIVCLQCINHEDHPESEDMLSLPTFDLTSYAIRGGLNDSSSHGDTILNDNLHRAVNLLHGRWGDRDEATYRSRAT